MKKILIIILFVAFSIDGVYSSNRFTSDFMESTVRIVESFDFFKNKTIDTLYVNCNGAINFDIDTTVSGITLMFYAYREDIFLEGGNIWFETSKYIKVNNRIEYEFFFNSFNKIPDFEYCKGVAKCINKDGEWIIHRLNTKKIDYKKISKLTFPYDEPKSVKEFEKFNFNINRLPISDKNSLSYRIMGDWYNFFDSIYVEALITSNYFYQYSLDFGRLPTYEYFVKDDSLFINHLGLVNGYKIKMNETNDTLTCQQTYIDKNELNLDTTIVFTFEMFRIPENEFTMSDFKGWEEKILNNSQIKSGKKQIKYHNEFIKRREKIIEKYAL